VEKKKEKKAQTMARPVVRHRVLLLACQPTAASEGARQTIREPMKNSRPCLG
jgi:hypothetical protein